MAQNQQPASMLSLAPVTDWWATSCSDTFLCRHASPELESLTSPADQTEGEERWLSPESIRDSLC